MGKQINRVSSLPILEEQAKVEIALVSTGNGELPDGVVINVSRFGMSAMFGERKRLLQIAQDVIATELAWLDERVMLGGD